MQTDDAAVRKTAATADGTDTDEIIVAGDGGEVLDREPDVEYSTHTEPPAQGGERFVRCEECGAELLVSLGGEDNLVHRDGCPAGEGR